MSLMMLQSERKPFSQSGNIVVSTPIFTILFHAQHFTRSVYDPVSHTWLLQFHDERRQNAFVFSFAESHHRFFAHILIGIAASPKKSVTNLVTMRFAEDA